MITHTTGSRLLVCSVLTAMCFVPAFAEPTILQVQPRSCRPGEVTRITLSGTDLQSPLRVATNIPADVVVESADGQSAIIAVSLPNDGAIGPFGLFVATHSGVAAPIGLLSDDLPVVLDGGSNHTQETAQEVSLPTSIDGVSDAGASDWYCFQSEAGQNLSVEVLTHGIDSTMDPVVRLTNEAGETLRLEDDTDVGPESRFVHQFSTSQKVWLEVRDNRFHGGGAYHVRLGDFPLAAHAFPLAVQAGVSSQIHVVTTTGEFVAANLRPIPELAGVSDRLSNSVATISARNSGGVGSGWTPLVLAAAPQFVEPQSPATNSAATEIQTPSLSMPIGISGLLEEPSQQDSYQLNGTAGRHVRFQSRTKSLGCSTLLAMRLFDASGTIVAETSVTDDDEWSFDYTFSSDGDYRLEVRDLLDRGGPGFGYWIDVAPVSGFSVNVLPDTNARDRFVVEAIVASSASSDSAPAAETELPQPFGACVLPIRVNRFGYDQEIELSFDRHVHGLRLLNSTIAAGATEARLYIVADENWDANQLLGAELIAVAKEQSESLPLGARVSSLSQLRVKQPQIPFPPAWRDGKFVFAGAFQSSPVATLELPTASFARGQSRHRVLAELKRLHPEFKDNVTILPDALPSGWRFDTNVNEDVYSLHFTQADTASKQPTVLPLWVLEEFQGRARLHGTHLKVEWIDPLRVTMDAAELLFPGTQRNLLVHLNRSGDDPQPVTINLGSMPPGVIAPTSIEIPADQSQTQIPIRIADDVEPQSIKIPFTATSQFHGNPIELAGTSASLQIAALPARITVNPEHVTLAGPRDQRQLIVTGWDAANVPTDLTHHVHITSSNTNVAQAHGSVLVPKSNGLASVTVELGALQAEVQATVSQMETTPKIAFTSEVLVALSKQGCNSGACHGSPSGKGMFRLSLRAFDNELDELTLIHEDFGRRVNRMEPEQSLLLQKPMMQVSHGGGKRLHTTDAAYQTLKDWISEGAQSDPPDAAPCVRLELIPHEKRVLPRWFGTQQIAAIAHFADGSTRDVSRLVVYESSNNSVATVDQRGLVTPQGRGETVILVRFLEHIESLPLMFVEDVAGFEWTAPAPHNYVDELVYAKLQQLQFLPAENCSDSEFLRRVYLDVIGILPTVAESQQFLKDPHSNKRAMLIDQLLEREEYAKFWALKWGDLLRMTSKMVGDEGVFKYHRWVEEAFQRNMPYDEFARQLLTASGSTWSNPPASFYRTAADMNDCVETISQVFLGARLQCAKCHNHPFERWTQDNYFGLGAFFHRIERRKTQRPGEMFVWASTSGEVTQPRTGRQMAPWLPQTENEIQEIEGDRRELFARWLIAPDNPYFARMEANRIWSQLFARGIVDPVDDFRDSNPPANRPLLDALADDFTTHGFDRKHLLRVILNSRTYQSSCETNAMNEADTMYFSHQEPRLLSAEQLLDAINQSMGAVQVIGNLPAGTMATQLPAPDIAKVDFLKVFGQPERSSVCACERVAVSNLGMAIELLNGTTVHDRLRDKQNRIHQAIAQGQPLEEFLHELYLATLCRLPNPQELDTATRHCRSQEDLGAGLEDVCWALWNSDEFLFQH